MSLPSLIIASIIFSIMSMGVYTQSSIMIDKASERLQAGDMDIIKQSILTHFNETGNIETSLEVLNSLSTRDLLTIKDMTDNSFVILNNGGEPFSFNGSASVYRAVIIAEYSDGLNSEISSSEFLSRGGEPFVLIPQAEIDLTDRSLKEREDAVKVLKTLEKVTACNSASSNFNSANGVYPSSVGELIGDANNTYLEPYKLVDEYGHSLMVGATCYSLGPDGISGTEDDISL